MVNLFLMPMVMKLNILKENVFVIFGILIVGYILIIRLFINKLPRELPIIDSLFKFIFYCCIPLCFLVLAIIILLQYYKKLTKVSQTKLYVRILGSLSKFYWNSLLALDAVIKEKLPASILGENLLRFTKVYTNYVGLTKKFRYTAIFLLFVFVPKYLFLTLFLYDVFCLKKFTYIYYYGWLLLIPLAFNYLLFTLKEFSLHNLDRYIKMILLVIDDNDVLIEKVDFIIDSCTKLATEIYFDNNTNTQFVPALYAKICDKYLEDNNISDDAEIEFVASLRHQEFLLFRLLQTQMIIFNFIRERYNNILNSFYYICLALIWTFIILHGIIYIY